MRKWKMKEKSEKFVPKTEICEDCSHNKEIIICPYCGKEITICEFFKKNSVS